MKNKLLKLIVWLCVFNLTIASFFLGELKSVKADSLPTVQFGSEYSGGEKSEPNPEIEAILTGVTLESDLEVTFQIDEEKTTADKSMYQLNNNSSTILANENKTQVDLTIIDNNKFEEPKILVIDLVSVSENPYGVAVGEPSEFTYTIYNLPKTEIVKSEVDGQNGWYKTSPDIDFEVLPIDAKTYFQWNGKDELNWQEYDKLTSIDVSEGENTLYFYSTYTVELAPSVLVQVNEAVKTDVIKLDTIAPQAPSFLAKVTDTGFIELSWQSEESSCSYELYREDIGLLKTLSCEEKTMVDSQVKRGESYNYYIVLVDKAGNRSEKTAVNVIVPNLIVENTVQPPVVKPVKAISYGISTVKASPKESEITSKTQEKVEGAETTDTDADDKQNWNRLLLAISILMIAAGVLIGGYYGYEWLVERGSSKEEKKEEPKSKSRW